MVKTVLVALQDCRAILAGMDPSALRVTQVLPANKALSAHKATEDYLARTVLMACRARKECQD